MAEQGTGKTAIGIDTIVPAAISGKVDTLFCENNSDIFGNYRKEGDVITVSQSEEDVNAWFHIINNSIKKKKPLHFCKGF